MNLLEYEGVEFILGGTGVLVASLDEQVLPEHGLLLLLCPELLVDVFGDDFWVDVPVGFDAVRRNLLGVFLQKPVRRRDCFAQYECALHLVLALLVSWRRGLDADVPAMIIDVPRVNSGVGRLWVGPRECLIHEAFADQKLFVLVVDVCLVGESLGLRDAVVPLVGFGAKQVSVDFVLHYRPDLLRLGRHVLLLIEKLVLLAVVDLSVSNAANGFCRAVEPRGVVQNRAARAAKDSLTSLLVSRVKVLLFLLLNPH